MIIGLNGKRLLENDLAGPELYTLNTYRAMANLDKENDFIVYFDKQPDKKFWKELKGENARFKFKVIKKVISWTQISLLVELLLHPVDIFFTAEHTITSFHHPKTSFVSMIHGLEYKVNKNVQSGMIRNIIHPFVLWWVMVFSNVLIVPSKATKTAISTLNWPLIDGNKIRIVHEGVNDLFYKRSENEIKEIREKYDLGNKKYLLFVSTIQPRKNLPKTIEAFSNILKDPGFSDLLLVISGKKGWSFKKSFEAPKNFGIEDNVKFLGRTPEEDLPILLSGAEGLLNCSLEEGFGLPLLEAMACETPSVVSNIPAFCELGSDFPIYVDPLDTESIENGIKRLLSLENKDTITKQAYERSREYTWEKCARNILSIFESLFKNI